MITEGQFSIQFEKLQASFGFAKSEKIQDAWFKEFEDCEYSSFVKAMHRCQYGDSFPSWEKFRGEYRNCEGGSADKKSVVYCGACKLGKVFFQKEADGQATVANCSKCCPDDMPGLSGINPDFLLKDQVGNLWTRKAAEESEFYKPPIEGGFRITQAPGEIAQKIYGREDPEKERAREKNLYADKKREEASF